MSARLSTWLAACAIALLLGASHLLDGPTDHHAEWAQAQDLQDAIKTEAASARFDKAARAICGENAAWIDLGSGSIQCATKRGHKTMVAEVQP